MAATDLIGIKLFQKVTSYKMKQKRSRKHMENESTIEILKHWKNIKISNKQLNRSIKQKLNT